MTVLNYADAIRYGSAVVDRVYAGSVKVWERFRPTNLSGCVVWLDASSLNLSNGAAVPGWTNLAGGPNPVLLGSPNPVFRTTALNTKMPCVRITRGQGRFRFTGLNFDKEYTLFIVGRRWALSWGRILTALAPASNVLYGWHGNEFDCAYAEGWLTTPGPEGGVISTTQWKLYSADSSAAGTSRLFSDGRLLGSHPTPPATKGFGGTLCISGYNNDPDPQVSQQADAEIAEIVVYNRKLSDADRQSVERYLRVKWNPLTKFKPTDLGANCLAWFDASDVSSIILGSDDGRVIGWLNKGAGPMGLTQTTSANRPTYANNAVNFAPGQIMNPVSAPNGFDFFVVSRPNLQGDWRTLLRSGSGHEMIIEATSNRFGVYTTTAFNPAGALTWPGVDGIGFSRAAAGAVTMMSRDGGALTATATALPVASVAPTMFGAFAGPPPSQPWGSINEVIFLPYNLEGGRQMVEGYLAHKWNLAALLPSNHPYKVFPP